MHKNKDVPGGIAFLDRRRASPLLLDPQFRAPSRGARVFVALWPLREHAACRLQAFVVHNSLHGPGPQYQRAYSSHNTQALRNSGLLS